MIRVKRTYEPPSRGDGRRFLVDRLWPRGIKKEDLAADAWMKDVAPSASLRTWFAHRTERWDEFGRRYRAELDANPAAWSPILDAARHGTVTLLYSARDTVHNGALVLRDYLAERTTPAGSSRASTASSRRESSAGPARAGARRKPPARRRTRAGRPSPSRRGALARETRARTEELTED